MTWLAPWFLAAGVLGALGVVAAHLLARHRPPRAMLPTARFVPPQRPVSATRLARPSDLALLALRALAVLLLGAAFARPVRLPAPGSVARVVALDRSREVARIAVAADSARALLRPGDLLILFDSAAPPPLAGDAAAKALDGLARSPAAGSVSAALAAAIPAGATLRARADSVELVLVSPAAARELDAATQSLRRAWPGRVRLVPLARQDSTARAAGVQLRAGADDPLVATFSLAGIGTSRAEAGVRVLRGSPAPDDLAWARGADRVLVVWPAGAEPPPGWSARAAADTIGAVLSSAGALVAPFARTLRPPAGQVVARWADGEPAATERQEGAGCVRHVAIPIAATGDLALRAAMRRLALALTGACAAPGEDVLRSEGAASVEAGDIFTGGGPLASARALARLQGATGGESPLVPWLLGAAALLLLLEMPLRGRARRGES